ncbi:uncharacterized protein LOC141910053 [Tubulanus polymorphus]|uniref:uncharacterized protein LOC141910053 n=1 Tax=Tubulanus polymorphus TaxID=672921 RepID=UPI003DA2DE71
MPSSAVNLMLKAIGNKRSCTEKSIYRTGKLVKKQLNSRLNCPLKLDSIRAVRLRLLDMKHLEAQKAKLRVTKITITGPGSNGFRLHWTFSIDETDRNGGYVDLIDRQGTYFPAYGDHFRKLTDDADPAVAREKPISSIFARSRIECAMVCRSLSHCISFQFAVSLNKDTKQQCVLMQQSSNGTSSSGGAIYTRGTQNLSNVIK